MITLAVVCLVCVTAYAIADRWATVWHNVHEREVGLRERAEKQSLEVEKRHLDMQEREVALKERAAQSAGIGSIIPPDLLNRVRMWEDPIAQDAERATLREMYADLGDWDLVRKNLTPLAPIMTTEIAAPRDGMFV